MTDTPAAAPARLAQTIEEVEDALLSRWPETRLEPSLDRIEAFTELLGRPQDAYPVIHLTGTNGKTSTSRMIEALLGALDLRTGRFTSPHLERINERISVDGEPLDDEAFVRAFNDVAPYTHLVDEDQPHPLSFFETVVGMAYAAFADAPVEVAVVEVGMGGSWDATNVMDAQVAVVLPIAIDHARYLGATPEAIAVEKAGIVKPGSIAVLAQQTPEVAAVLQARADEVGARVVREGLDFGVVSRAPAVGGQVVTLQGLRGRYEEVFLALHGAHQAQNAAVALAAVEAFVGGDEPLGDDVVRRAFTEVTSPGRLEVVRRGPTVVLDAAHNPHGAEAAAAAIEDAFRFSPLIGVFGVMADKEAEPLLAAFEPHLAHVVVTQNSTERAMPAEELAAIAREVFGEDRVTVEPRLPDALDVAMALAEAGEALGDPMGAGAVLVTGSVVTAGQARTLLARPTPARPRLSPARDLGDGSDDGDLSDLSDLGDDSGRGPIR
ncbi:bifunctional folylpolyglutamate synthase/dihydrofolate synthase [Nocardioides sp. TRM66260-LWL]|uniref:bifunctional folylpolyglutamate synthase/dihydrofolate synthase n=1 Tax=Nocardioides sp. TRM66260-LWL TaxID=2874478 RepID=UPI001CC5F96E|nr:folylpolyglutamate synthase/dihydrofolate synthase family protein [Nocardioides sp. TRM66260-LWL]MBZ5733033.1 bifunctional folylpolyglutamate synthase/dihydrofolate synthase [Nocardioides sp. TRM66260-LWL]